MSKTHSDTDLTKGVWTQLKTTSEAWQNIVLQNKSTSPLIVWVGTEPTQGDTDGMFLFQREMLHLDSVSDDEIWATSVQDIGKISRTEED